MNKYTIKYLKDGSLFDVVQVLRTRRPSQRQALSLMGSMAGNFTVEIEIVERDVIMCVDCGELEAGYGSPVQWCINCRVNHISDETVMRTIRQQLI